ncbi:hypothetical protein BFP77_11760 [Maribacter sp. 4U21]|uniref:outer membrane beta-barrel protein n=1 Tax=Maribacter sp. 4U21 TaxID=1889779 RepID=UPI000C152A35|nr:outer membrane beta-barrel protein [Maribacter sp. 4U21]PIB27558.1 hypothetical protein BFP77_11760 [Maribacter sp. 4U21]
MNKNLKSAIGTLSIVIILLFSVEGFSQDFKFGISAGLLNGSGKIKDETGTLSASNTGFYTGAFANIKLNEKFGLMPEVDYGNLNGNSSWFFSTRANYYFVPKFYVQAGPQVFLLSRSLTDDIKQAGIDAVIGAGYDITDHFHLQARYSFELTDRFKVDNGGTAKLNNLLVGIGYSF